MSVAECPECSGTITFNAAAVAGSLVACPDCGAELDATALASVDVELAPTEAEDWGE
jgi:alpha-aminoadipate carrier protein LysW